MRLFVAFLGLFLCLPSFASPTPLAPIALTIFSSADGDGSWFGYDGSDSCEALLTKGRPSFQALSLSYTFMTWNQGNPANPMDVRQKGYLHVQPASELAINSLVDCMGHAARLGYAPILLKISLMDYAHGYDHQWRGLVSFNPLNGNYFSDPNGPAGVAIQALDRFKKAGFDDTKVIVSICDEYEFSEATYPLEWKKTYAQLREAFRAQGTAPLLSANINWSFPLFRFAKKFWDYRNRKQIRQFFDELDLIGWSMYQPFFSKTDQGVLKEQARSLSIRRKWLNKLGLQHKPMAVFEFGVTNRKQPSEWNPAKRNLEDRARAYTAWLRLLRNEGGLKKPVPVSGIFAFWFGDFDPRTVCEQGLRDFAAGAEKVAACKP